VRKADGWVRYFVGPFKDFKTADDRREKGIGTRFKGAFVVAFNNGSRITVAEAKELTGYRE